MGILLKSFIILIVGTISSYCYGQEYVSNLLPVDPPKFYALEQSPLQNRETLKSREYFDFLNTLYRHDKTKSNLFDSKATEIRPIYISPTISGTRFINQNHSRQKREIVFRPLFAYRQQQLKKRKLHNKKKGITTKKPRYYKVYY